MSCKDDNKLRKQGKYDITEDKTNMPVLSILSKKIYDDPKKGNVNIKSFTGNKSDLKTTRKHLNTRKICHKPELIMAGQLKIKLEI